MTEVSPHALQWRLSASLVALCRTSWLPPRWQDGVDVGADEDYSVCILKRSAKSSFMPSSAVFPGGQLDPSDEAFAKQGGGPDQEMTALRIAAARETFEEAGLLLGNPAPTAAARASARTQLNDGRGSFSESLAAWKLEGSLAALARIGSFTTPDFEAARHKKGGFVAHFFVAAVPSAEEAALAAADGAEVTQLLWATPSAALRMAERGELAMAPPQWYILNALRERLPKLEGLAVFTADDGGRLFRDFPFKPAPLRSTDEAEMPLALPGDESHPEFPGPIGRRNRFIVSVKGLKVIRLESTVAYPVDAVGPPPPRL